MTAVLRGGDVRILGVTSKIFPYSLIASKGVKSVKELVGGKLAVNRLGDVSAIASRVALRNLGLNPDKDVTMLQVGVAPAAGGAAIRRGSGAKLSSSCPDSGCPSRVIPSSPR